MADSINEHVKHIIEMMPDDLCDQWTLQMTNALLEETGEEVPPALLCGQFWHAADVVLRAALAYGLVKP